MMENVLNKSNLLKHARIKFKEKPFSKEEVLKATECLGKIKYSDDNIILFDEEGNQIAKCPNFGASTEIDAEWISTMLSDLDFDVDYNGNVAKAEEATANYCLKIVKDVLNDSAFNAEYDDLVSLYDFDKCRIRDGAESEAEHKSFKDLLISWQLLQSYTINVLVSAAKFKISDQKKDSAQFLRVGLDNDVVLELRKVDREVSNIYSTYAKNELSPENIRKLEKVKLSI